MRTVRFALRRLEFEEAHMAEPEVLTMTVVEAATALGVSRSTAYECVRTGQLRAVRLGRRLVVPRSAIDELLAGATSVRANPIGRPDESHASSSVER